MLHDFNNDIFSILIIHLDKHSIINLQYTSHDLLNKLIHMSNNIWKILIIRDFNKYLFDENEKHKWLINGTFKEYLLHEKELQLWTLQIYREFYGIKKNWKLQLKSECENNADFEWINYKQFDTKENFSIYIFTKYSNLNIFKLFFSFIPIDILLNKKLKTHNKITLESFAWSDFKIKNKQSVNLPNNDDVNILINDVELICEIPRFLVARCYWGIKIKVYDYYFTVKNDEYLYVLQTNIQMSKYIGLDSWSYDDYNRRFYRIKKIYVNTITELMINSHVVDINGFTYYYFDKDCKVLANVMDIRMYDEETGEDIEEGFEDRKQRLDFLKDPIPNQSEELQIHFKHDNLHNYEKIARILSLGPSNLFNNRRNN